ncbi:hypothetical protein [Acidovorax sp. RAC01]|uniref:hypothetical protein n=1 Tax=Acidovorax sp. RAC01 TaxID=1842533 RepID=UPI00083E8C81|nr:hypothetical protein [Acidovorax sp. RAC01]AOG22135.1 hypothetical protein BSY15_434 [Acidovorax sp. RAC01]
MPEKNLRVFFYSLNALGDDEVTEVDYLWSLFTKPDLYHGGVSRVEAVSPSTGKSCELREVSVVGGVVKGCLALLREDLPTLRRQDGNEAPLPIANGDRLIEKNYFLYFREARLLLWQFNLAANHVANMALMLSTLGGMARAVSYSHVIKTLFALEQDQVIEYVDLKIGAPRKKVHRLEVAQLDPTNWGLNPFKVLADTGSRQLEIMMQNRTEDGLTGAVRNLVRDLTGLSVTRKLKVKVDGATEPIDMLAERFTFKITMQCLGVTATAAEIFQALQQAKDLYDAEQTPPNPG